MLNKGVRNSCAIDEPIAVKAISRARASSFCLRAIIMIAR